MATPVAQASDVSDRLPTNLASGEISTYLEDAVFDLEQEYSDLSSKPDDWRKQVEWRIAAVKILQFKEREVTSEQRESASLTYDTSRIDELKDEVRDLTDSKIFTDEKQADFEVF